MANFVSAWRRRLGTRRALLVVSSALCSGLVAPAWGQGVIPFNRANIDENSVDLATGTLKLSIEDVRIGLKNNGLSSSTYWINYGGFSGGFKLFAGNNGGNDITVSLPNKTLKFRKNLTQISSLQNDGDSLSETVSNYYYKDRYGVVITFEKYAVYGTFVNAIASKIQYPNGYNIDLTYEIGSINSANDSARVISVKDSNGYQINYAYQASGASPPNLQNWGIVTGITTRNTKTSTVGPSASYNYSFQNSYITEINASDAVGRLTRYRITNVPGNFATLTGVTRPGSLAEDVTISYSYPNNYLSSPKVTSIVTAAGGTSYAYSDSGNLRTTSVTDSLGHVTQYVFDMSILKLKSVTDATGRVTTYQYDSNGRQEKKIAPEGNYTQYSYDDRGNIVEEKGVAKPGSGISDIVVSNGYDSTAACLNSAKCNLPNWTKDPRGGRTDYTYDNATGNVVSITAPAGSGGLRATTNYEYAAVNGALLPTGSSTCSTAVVCAGSGNETKTAVAYNANGLPTAATVQAGDGSVVSTATIAYDGVGNMISVDGPLAGNGDTTVYRYNAGRELVGVVEPSPNGGALLKRKALRNTYDARGRLAATELGVVTDASDAAWNTFSSIQQVNTTYDGVDRPIQQTVIAGGVTHSSTQYSYDSKRLDKMTTEMNGSGPDRITKYTYDDADRQIKITSAYGTSDSSDDATITYTLNGQQATMTDAKGNVTSYAYDGFDRLSRTCFQAASSALCAGMPADYEQLSYDSNGNIVNRRLRDGRSIGFSYDALNRRTSMTFNNPVDVTDSNVSYSYDLLGRLQLAQDANGHKIAYAYDALGRTTSETGAWSTLTSQYDAAGRRTRLTWGDGFFVTYEYDMTGAMTAIRENGGLVLASYGYDDLGRRVSRTLGNGTSTSYGYDNASRLTALNLTGGTQANATTFAYNPAGQIVSRTASSDAFSWAGASNVDRAYSVNGLNQYTASGSVIPTYDARGNVTSAGGASYLYNSKNQLSGANGTYIYYDPAGRIDQVMQSGLAWDWDGNALATEYQGGGIAKRYVHGAGVNEPIVSYDGPGTGVRRWLDADERGSIVRITDDAGSAITVNTYDEYGIPGSGNAGRFQYTGQIWLPELGFQYSKARMYSPTFGRFMQPDPIGYGDGINWYNYVGSDPINRIDPSGLCVAPVNMVCELEDIVVNAIRSIAIIVMPGTTNVAPPILNVSNSIDDIVVTGKKMKVIAELPNSGPSFSCTLTTTSPYISVSITPFTVGASRIDARHSGWPRAGNQEMRFFLNPGTPTSTRFGGILLAGRESVFDLASRIRSDDATSYSHNINSRAMMEDVEMRFNISISSPGGGSGTCTN